MNAGIIKKIIIISIIILLFGMFYYFNLGQYFDLEYLKKTRESFKEIYSNNPLLVIAVYMLIYIVSAALSLPGAAILTLAGGAMFGLVVGTIVVSFASSLGALVACFVAKYILGDWIQQKFGDKLVAINNGIEKEGAFYLFTLRLIPIFPFWAINLLMGLTKFPLFKFYWVSQIGMLAATIVYVNAGNELGKVNSVSDILSLNLLISFIVLAVFPLLVKKILDLYKSKFRKTESPKG